MVLYLSVFLFADYQGDLSSFSVPKKVVLSYGQPKDPNGHHDEILTMDVSFDGKYLISAGKDRMIIIWNLIDMNFKDALRGHRDTINVRFHTH